MNADEISIQLTRKQADEFLRKLEEDEEFRGRLTQGGSETVAALAELEIEAPLELVPDKIVLPQPEHIRQFRRGTQPEEDITMGIDIFWIDIIGGLLALCSGFKRREARGA